MKDSTRIRVKKGKAKREVEMGVRRNMHRKERRIPEQIQSVRNPILPSKIGEKEGGGQ